MNISETRLAGAFIVDVEAHADERGLFARTFCAEVFADFGLPTRFVQCNTSYNARRGTLRGMHFQRPPHAEGKLVRCAVGAVFDVFVDLRPKSPTYCQWQGLELNAENRRALYIPPMIAHGFQVLVDGSEVFYQMTEFYHPESADGVRWDDPAFGIDWPIYEPILSERDSGYPDFQT